PNTAKKYKIGMVHQHFKLVQPFTITENITLSNSNHNGTLLHLTKHGKKIKEISDKYNFGLDPKSKIKDLTVGQQQKVEILKMLYNEADILIFDEPTGALIPSEIDSLMKIILDLKEA